jgi:hypothetical protein
VLLLLGVQLLAVGLSTQLSGGPATRTFAGGVQMTLVSLGTAAGSSVIAVANLLALFWFGMWMGMTSKTANFATLKTIVFVQVLPWFGIAIATTTASVAIAMSSGFTGGGRTGVATIRFSLAPLFYVAVPVVLNVLKSWAFVYWSRKKLYLSFRDEATRSIGQTRIATTPPLAVARQVPPSIPASP